MSERIPEHAARIETPAQVADRGVEEALCVGGRATLHAITIDRDQIRRALGMALIGQDELPLDALRRVRKVLDQIGGPL